MRTRPILFLCLLLFLSACGGSPATSLPEEPTATFTPQPSPTAAAPLVILVLPADMPQKDSEAYQTLVYDLAQQNGMRFQVRNTLTVAELEAELPALKVVLALPPDPGLAGLAAASPGVQFLAVDIPGLAAGGNLSTIGGADGAVDKQAFLAGYITTMLASEWRVGLMTQRDTAAGNATWAAFVNGFHYFCGYCRSTNFLQPYPEYPVVLRLPVDTPVGDYTGWAALLLDNFVRAAYVSPELATPDLLAYLAEYGVLLMGDELPGEDLRANWIASIQPDIIPAIQNTFAELLAGNGGRAVATPLYLTDVNSDLLTEGKMRLAQEVLAGLQDGTIGTGVNP